EQMRSLGGRCRGHDDRRERLGKPRRIALEARVLLGRHLGDDRDVAATHRTAEKGREAALALARLPEPTPQMEILDPQDAAPSLRIVEECEAALLPLTEMRHAGDHALAGQPPDVEAAIEVLVQREAVLDEAIVHPLQDQRGLAATRRTDHADGARSRT